MKPTIIFSIIAMCTVASLSAHAQTYQWKDSSGRTVISDMPPPGAANKSVRTINTAKPISSTSTQSKNSETETEIETPKTIADKEMDFKKRQQEAKELAEKTAKEKAAASEKMSTCQLAKQNLAILESGSPMGTTGPNGEQTMMSNIERSQEAARLRQILLEHCSK